MEWVVRPLQGRGIHLLRNVGCYPTLLNESASRITSVSRHVLKASFLLLRIAITKCENEKATVFSIVKMQRIWRCLKGRARQQQGSIESSELPEYTDIRCAMWIARANNKLVQRAKSAGCDIAALSIIEQCPEESASASELFCIDSFARPESGNEESASIDMEYYPIHIILFSPV